MKRTNRLLIWLLIVMLLNAVFSAGALASGKAIPLKQGSYYELKPLTGESQVYKLTLKKDSVLTVSWLDDKRATMNVDMYTDEACTKHAGHVDSRYDSAPQSKGSVNLVLLKGAYYFRMYDDNAKAKVQFRAKNLGAAKNTTPDKAVNLKKNKEALSGSTAMSTCLSWYRIKLSKRQAVNLHIHSYGEFNVTVYDAEMRSHGGCNAGGHFKMKNTYEPGVYYIAVLSCGGQSLYCANSVSILWK